MSDDPFTEDDRRLIVSLREHFRWQAKQPHPLQHWIDETRGLMDGTLYRKWHHNPDYMTKGEPVGYWSTERRK